MEIRGKNEYEHLILKYDEEIMNFVDITKDVFYLTNDHNSWRVGFSSNGKYYYFPLSNLKVSINPIKINIKGYEIYINKRRRYDVINIIRFADICFKVFFKEFKSIIIKDIKFGEGRIDIDSFDLNIRKTGNNVFDYYKTLSKYAAELTADSNSDDDVSIEGLLYNLYNCINEIRKDSVLEAYTEQTYDIEKCKIKEYIYPFSTNMSQMAAITQTFNNKLSVISGPPGTGKTQVILNLIANAVYNNLNVAVISNNNTAIENVYDKMKEEGYDFLLAYLGNNKNVDNFFSIEDNIEEVVKKYTEQKDEDKVNDIVERIKDLFNNKNNEVTLNHKLYETKEEYKHFNEKHEIVDYSSRLKTNMKQEDIIKLKGYLLSLKKIGFFKRLVLKYKFKTIIYKDDSLDCFITFLDSELYKAKIKEIELSIQKIKNYIKDKDFDNLSKELKSESKLKFNNYLIDRYIDCKNSEFNKNNYKEKFYRFVYRYPVVLSTTHSLLRNIPSDYAFSLIIIDEASQSDILTSILTMNAAKQMVIVGDDKQLSQIDNQEIYDFSNSLAKNNNIDKCYQYKDNSILQSVLSLPNKVEKTILKEHYRCDARIIEFCNRKFYNNQLIVCTDTSDDDPLIIVHTVEGNHARKNPNGSGQYNDREAQEIIEIIKKCDTKDIGIITPFRAQANYIRDLLKDTYPFVEVDTIHKYQGRQKEIVILSTVVNDLNVEEDDFITDFVTNSKLLNVAISRAVKKLYLVVSDKVYNSSNNTISQFIDYIKYYCSESSVKKGQVVSIFDKLYNLQNSILKKTKCYKYVDSYAEELMRKSIVTLLNNYSEYKLVMHHRLSDLISNYNGFNEDEIRYINHHKTHVDFVIFNTVTHKPVLCIEVDGTRYHDYAKVQKEHDIIKNRILKANNINILRLKTNESNEIGKIKKYL